MKSLRVSTVLFLLSFLLFSQVARAQEDCNLPNSIPFSTNSKSLTMWNGEQYVPLFIKGVNLGVAVPGTYPSELAATRAQYGRWFKMIQEAGFNTIRLYTLHHPRFYEVLDSFNTANPQRPLFFFQGIWLEEEIPNYDEDLYSLTPYFDKEIEEDVDCVHGNRTIAPRLGKAHGVYKTDASKWLMGYIIGREVHPGEVLHTNEKHAQDTQYQGRFLSIQNTRPTEAWMTKRLDNVLAREQDLYKTQHPVSFSSWPTLDPMKHPQEANQYEDAAAVDLSTIDISKAKAGYFASYHAYPYYPDFVSKDPAYGGSKDYLGQNSYVGYLSDLKKHYKNIPLIIAEYGVPSSWGVAHYAQSGMNHGGFDEQAQGESNLRLLQNMEQTNLGGGMQFSWIDEWFKRTWITDEMDFDINRRILWHNVTSAEQNFGLVGFKKPGPAVRPWTSFCATCPAPSLDAGADYTFFNLRLNTGQPLGLMDTVWVALDTYDANLGESQLPNGKTLTNRSEFLLMITQYKAELYVTEAYDLFGIWHNTATPEQLFRSTATDGKPWKLVRWRNNTGEQEVQFIGDLRVNRLGLPGTSMDAVILNESSIDIKLPWTLINFTDPSTLTVMHDDRSTRGREVRVSDGISASVFYKGSMHTTPSRFTWEPWNHTLDVQEYTKASYEIAKKNLRNLPGNPIARCDRYIVQANKINQVLTNQGVLKNDLALDGGNLEAVLEKSPATGQLILFSDGGFTYVPEEGKTGPVSFIYKVISGAYASVPVTVELSVEGDLSGDGFSKVYPNPTSGDVSIEARTVVDKLEIYTATGQLVSSFQIKAKATKINLDTLAAGLYVVKLYSGKEVVTKKLVIQN
ncbi:T9SS type A sorting domain-containing protein [Rufibacter sp. DG15C]|uniref:T9SS type A sorting domain-containing protein n=1 Tax=Rufibacter sp. DG15C TaxID=1379909 RepID=UPI0012FC901A|nr:T9SS type A sorting domain-containing protein [Rufibacter sp. DG15C]